jgi:hypothetical protein
VTPATPQGPRTIQRVLDVGGALAFPLGLLAALIAYLLFQRFVDRGRKLAWLGSSSPPDDELIEF